MKAQIMCMTARSRVDCWGGEGQWRITEKEMNQEKVIHADFQFEGTLKVIKRADYLELTKPGILKLPKETIYKGGVSKARNPRMQVMLRMIGYGDSAGSGFPTILAAWKDTGWGEPDLIEDTILNQVTLTLPTAVVRENDNSSNEILHGTVNLAIDPEMLMNILEFCETPRSRAEIQERCGYKAATYFRNKVLNPLIEGGQLELTIPETPNHPRQKYVRKKTNK